jgi:mRNA turnover protein 4
MPKSKRSKVVNLTKVKSRGREGKENLVEKVQDNISKYENSYVINFENMRSGPFKQL